LSYLSHEEYCVSGKVCWIGGRRPMVAEQSSSALVALHTHVWYPATVAHVPALVQFCLPHSTAQDGE